MKIEVGKILKAQGIKGEVKIECYLDDPSLLKGIELLYIGSSPLKVEAVRGSGSFCYVRFREVNDRNKAESLCGKTVFADKEKIILPVGRYFVQDVIGMQVFLNSGENVGTVEEILQYGAADVYVCKGNGKDISFPFLNDLVLKIDEERRTIELDAKRFSEVAVYED